MKKKKNRLPSGRYRVQITVTEGGNRVSKSFTADTLEEARAAAESYRRRVNGSPDEMTVRESAERYISLKNGVLSPSTVRGYKGIVRNYLSGNFGLLRLHSVTPAELQRWISDLAERVSPKTVRNAYGLVLSSVKMFMPSFSASPQLPQKIQPELYTPSDDDIKKILESVTDPELKLAIMLGAFGTLRRGEICALTREDVHKGVVTVNKAMVQDADKQWHIKAPKTAGSYRTVPIPPAVEEAVKALNREPGERLIQCAPTTIGTRFDRAVKKAGLPHIRFHDLRHYSASILHAIGVPDQYIMELGGWSSDYVMKRVYRGAISEEKKKQEQKILDHFSRVSSV